MPIQENFISWPHFSIDLQYKDVLHRIWKQEIVFCFNNLPEVLSGLQSRDRPRFFDQVGHQTTNASVENKHFFTK